MEEIKLKSEGKGVNEDDDAEHRVGGNKKATIRFEQDRLSSLPDEIIHHILSFTDTKYAVQTSVLSLRWKFIWKSLPYLNFSTDEFRILPKFSKFVNRVLSLRNNQTEVSSVDLSFRGRVSQKFVEKISSYAMSHNVQKAKIYADSPDPKGDPRFPLCLFTSQSLKQLRIKSELNYYHSYPLPQSPWNFPALTTLHLKCIWLCNNDTTSLELFSKCVNLKNLTLRDCRARSLEVMKIIAPRLETLSISSWWITRFLLSTPNLSSLYYESDYTPSFSASDLQFLDKVNLRLMLSFPNLSKSLQKSKEDLQRDAQKLFNLFEELRSAKCLTLHSSVIEFLSTVPDLLETQPSPFSNLEIKEFEKQNTTSIDSANHVINYLLSSSATATVIMELPKEQPKKPRKKIKVGARKFDLNKRLDSVTERHKAEVQAQVQGHLEEREAQMDKHKAEMDTLFENINAEIHDITTESSHTTSITKTFQEQSMLNSSCTNAEQVSTTNNEERTKEIRAGIDGAAISRQLKGRMDAFNERQLTERETLLERHRAERLALLGSQTAELMAMIEEVKAQG